VADDRPPARLGLVVPGYPGGQLEARDGLVVVAQQRADLAENPIRHHLGRRAVGHLTGDVGEDLAPLPVHAKHPRGAVEADPFQVAQESVDGGRPRPGKAPHRVSDLSHGADETTGQRFLFAPRIIARFHEGSLARPLAGGV